jgi:ornithine carbamoyltransferase
MKRDFLHITDLSKEEIFEIFDLATQLKKETMEGTPHPHLQGKSMAMIFQKPTAR